MNKITIPIKGMHCRSCELLIEEKLKEIPDIKNVHVNYKKKCADIYSKRPIDQNLIRNTVEEAGYEVGSDESKAWITKDVTTFKDILYAAIVLALIYLIAKKLGVFNISVGSLSNPSNLSIVFLIGIAAGLSTCMALVGGLILGISAKHSEKHPEATSFQKFRPHLFFNVGRISSYFILGGIVGLVGKAFQLSGATLGFLTILVGLVMLLLGLQLTELFPRLSNISLTLPSGISKFFGIKNKHQKEYSHTNSIITGALTFFLPCGFTQAMQLYAMSTGSFWRGAFILGTFAVGTAPGLLGVGGLTSIIKGIFARRFFKFAGIVVTLLAILNISNGFNLTGISLPKASDSNNNQTVVDDPNVKIENGVQVVRMDQVAGGYRPNSFTIKKGIPVRWIVNSKKPDSCAASIYSAKLGIRKSLEAGENIFEFTPTETGKIPFSCSMGMYTGSFTVIDNPTQDTPKIQSPSADSTLQKNTDTQETPESVKDEQIVKTTYTYKEDIQPNKFTVKAGKPVRFEVEAKDDGQGCMSSITIPGLTKDFDYLTKGKTTVFTFTPDKPGKYYVTCAMGSPRGIITVE